MAGGIFLVQGDRGLSRLREERYDAEDVLQRLLADHPDLLAGDQIDPSAPRRWLLVARELDVPGDESGAGRWSLDHLFLDQDAVPTIVEVKRSTDTRLRREVVGQMLDYAANAAAYWPPRAIRDAFALDRTGRGEDPDAALTAFLGDGDPDGFWVDVERNLRPGRIRLVFVADDIPPELQRIVEFLDGQMNPAQVVAVEVRQFVGDGVQALVPRVVGRSATTQQAKAAAAAGSRGVRKWDEASFLARLTATVGELGADAARALLAWARDRELRLWWGKGKQDGSCYPEFDRAGRSIRTFALRTSGRVEVSFGYLAEEAAGAYPNPFADRELRLDLRDRLNRIPGVVIPEVGIDKYPTFPLAALVDPDARRQFTDAMDWVLAQFRHADAAEASLDSPVANDR